METKALPFRYLTVIRNPDGKSNEVPLLRLKGHWFDQAGFPVGSKVIVSISPKRVIIDLIEKHSPRLPQTIDPADCVY
jgi:hypothetical protein